MPSRRAYNSGSNNSAQSRNNSNAPSSSNNVYNSSSVHSRNNSALSRYNNSAHNSSSNSAYNNKNKMKNCAGRDSSANKMSAGVRVHVRNRGTFGSSIGHTPGIPSTAPGSNAAATTVTAYLTTGSATPSARIITFEFTANP